MLTAYGNAGQVEIMGIDLPPLVLAAEAFGRSAAPWLIVPFVVCAYAEEHLANGYVVMIQSNGEDAKVLALKFILVATALSLCTAVAMSVCILLVCALLCRGTLDAAYMTSLASAGVRVLTDSMAINYAGAILVGMLRVVAIGAASMGFALIARWKHAGVLAIPMIWLTLSYTPAMTVIAGVLGTLGMPPERLAKPVYSLMAYTETSAALHVFLCSEISFCLVVLAASVLVAVKAPRSLRVKAAGVTQKNDLMR
ncbi:hypothetical protein [Collinsella stercoris]|jgi:hypothetical protein|nr:hypothetical protein [Collinsella stercoris]MBS6556029.1 hypothetical protein [Collinsella stercoris]